jgi:hypothetical protein
VHDLARRTPQAREEDRPRQRRDPPAAVPATAVMALQRAAGNHAVADMLRRADLATLQRFTGRPPASTAPSSSAAVGEEIELAIESMDEDELHVVLDMIEEESIVATEADMERIIKRFAVLDAIAKSSARATSEFESDSVYVRKTARIADEITYVLRDRHSFYVQGQAAVKAAVEGGYWHAATPVIKDLPSTIYSSFKGSGLVISTRDAELAGWGKTDMGLPTKNVPKTSYPGGFPATPAGRGGKTVNTVPAMVAKLKDIRARVKGEKPDVSSTGKPRGPGQYVYKDYGDGDGPMPVAEKTAYAGAAEIEYSEAQIHYQPKDILGVYVELDDDNSLTEAVTFQRRLGAEFGVHVPLVQYGGGRMITFGTVEKLLDALMAKDADRHQRMATALRAAAKGA